MPIYKSCFSFYYFVTIPAKLCVHIKKAVLSCKCHCLFWIKSCDCGCIVSDRARDSLKNKTSVSIPRRSLATWVAEKFSSCAMTCFTAFPRWQTTLHPRDEPWVMRADQEFLRSVHACSSQVRDASQGSLFTVVYECVNGTRF